MNQPEDTNSETGASSTRIRVNMVGVKGKHISNIATMMNGSYGDMRGDIEISNEQRTQQHDKANPN